MKPVLVGLAPSRKVDDDYIPLTGSDTGKRLMELVGVDDPRAMAERFELINLLDGPSTFMPRDLLAKKAMLVLDQYLAEGCRFVLFGNDVCRAMPKWARPTAGWFEWQRLELRGGRPFFVAKHPHPSPLVRMWNDPHTTAQAKRFFEELSEDVVQ